MQKKSRVVTGLVLKKLVLFPVKPKETGFKQEADTQILREWRRWHTSKVYWMRNFLNRFLANRPLSWLRLQHIRFLILWCPRPKHGLARRTYTKREKKLHLNLLFPKLSAQTDFRPGDSTLAKMKPKLRHGQKYIQHRSAAEWMFWAKSAYSISVWPHPVWPALTRILSLYERRSAFNPMKWVSFFQRPF